MSDLEARVRLLEDVEAVRQLVSAYGLAVDSGSAGATAALWTEDGTYDVVPQPLVGRAALTAMVDSEGHRSLIARGCAHVLGAPHVLLDGDRAVATCHSLVLLRDAERREHRVWRVAANRWELVRTVDGWQVSTRVNRLLDGSDDAAALLAAGLAGGPS